MQGINYTCLNENPQIPHIMSALSEPHEGEGKLSFYFKKPIQKLQVTGPKKERGSTSSCSILQLPKVLW
jgi:hypothetical protein